jgi:hypothetical protein
LPQLLGDPDVDEVARAKGAVLPERSRIDAPTGVFTASANRVSSASVKA